MKKKIPKWLIFVVVLLLLVFLGPTPIRRKHHGTDTGAKSPAGDSSTNVFESFKHHGPDCDVSSQDLYEPRAAAASSSGVCPDRASMLRAMSSGGRIGRDAPYTARGCDMVWFPTESVCHVLDRFSQVVFVGDSMLRHVLGAVNILVREDLGYGAVTGWNFDEMERRQCFCLNQFNVKTCSVQGIYKTADVVQNDPDSFVCPRIIPGFKADLRIEQINKYPIPPDELERLRQVIRTPSTNPLSKRPVYILGHGLWSDLDTATSTSWLETITSAILENSPMPPPMLLVTPNAAGRDKEDRWLVTQGNKALVGFEAAMGREAARLGVEHLGTWNMSVQATMYDGVHMDMRGNLLKAMMVVNWLSLLEV